MDRAIRKRVLRLTQVQAERRRAGLERQPGDGWLGTITREESEWLEEYHRRPSQARLIRTHPDFSQADHDRYEEILERLLPKRTTNE